MTPLEKAATAIQLRSEVLELNGMTASLKDWSRIDEKHPSLIPVWYKEVLADYPLLGIQLFVPSEDGESLKMVRIRPVKELFDCEEDDEIAAEKGIFLFAEDDDANMWGIVGQSDVETPILYFSHTNGGVHAVLSNDKAVRYAAHNLAHLFASVSHIGSDYEPQSLDESVDLQKYGLNLWGEPDSFTERTNISNLKDRIPPSRS